MQQAVKIIVTDFNGDGQPDVFIADFGQDAFDPSQGTFPGRQNTLLLSTPEGKLIDATANLPQQSDTTGHAAAADIDGDGDFDLLILNLPGQKRIGPHLWLNDGTGRFTVA